MRTVFKYLYLQIYGHQGKKRIGRRKIKFSNFIITVLGLVATIIIFQRFRISKINVTGSSDGLDSNESSTDFDNAKHGAIVMLAKGEQNKNNYKELIKRNQSIRDYIWKCCNTDIIIFHEGNINLQHQQYISSFTPTMPIKFINISVIFSQFKYINKTECPTTKQSRRFNPGYHSMCYFWFISFKQYLRNYDWLFRFDADCQLISNSHNIIPPPASHNIYFSSSIWLDLQTEKYDMISPTKPDGEVVRGMKTFVQEFSSKMNVHSATANITTWRAPYTNVMYVNLTWLRSNPIINDFMDAVDASECIYSNRWGDSPLWGAAVVLADQPYHLLPVPYYHGSHHVLVDAAGHVNMQSRFFFIRWIQSLFWTVGQPRFQRQFELDLFLGHYSQPDNRNTISLTMKVPKIP
eukprot:gene11133-23271_t